MLQRATGIVALMFMLGLASASAQGTFGHLAYGGGWQTTFLVVNQDQTTEAHVSLSFYSDNGKPLTLAANGGSATSVYSFSVPANGSASVVIPDVEGSTPHQGWASLTVNNSPTVSGQAIFHQNPGGSRPALEAAVPFNTGAPACLVPFGIAASTHSILIPFDNKTSGHITALALANTTSAPMSVPIEFDDATGAALAADTLSLGPMNHTAFASTANYPATNGQSGVLRITLPGGASLGDLSVLALLADSVSGTLTTLLPINQ